MSNKCILYHVRQYGLWEYIEQDKGIGVFWMGWSKLQLLNREVGESLVERVTLGQRFEGGNGVSHTAPGGLAFQMEGIVIAKL